MKKPKFQKIISRLASPLGSFFITDDGLMAVFKAKAGRVVKVTSPDGKKSFRLKQIAFDEIQLSRAIKKRASAGKDTSLQERALEALRKVKDAQPIPPKP